MQITNRIILEEQTEVRRWLQGRNGGTKYTYFSALKAYLEYTGITTTELSRIK